MAFYLGASLMAQYEGSEQGITWSSAGNGDFGVNKSIMMLLIGIAFWLFVAWYLDQVTMLQPQPQPPVTAMSATQLQSPPDQLLPPGRPCTQPLTRHFQVMPSEYGLQRRPWFLCSPYYWCDCKSSTSLGAGDSDGPLAVEPLPARVTNEGVRTTRLRKAWNRKSIAVHGLDIEMCRGQITGLLGANGAGKTTTISMLTGLIPPSSGDAFVDGKSILTDMAAIRLSLGVCPQVCRRVQPSFTPFSLAIHISRLHL